MYRLGYATFIYALLSVCLAACTLPPAASRPVWVAVEKHEDRITWAMAENSLIFDIHSPSGIGSAAVLLAADDYPARVLLRFHLAGLEALRFAYDTTVVNVSVSSTGRPAVYQRATAAAGEEQAIAAESPYWMKTQLIAERVPSPAPIPLTDGYIEVELPPHFLRNQERAFTIEWVDFYR